MRRTLLPVVLMLVISLTGCSYLVNGVNDKISVNSNNPETEIYINGQPCAKGFAVIPLKRGDEYSIVGKAAGCKDAVYQGSWKINSLAALSFVTLPVDLALGTAWEVSQNSIMLNPSCHN